MKKKTTYLKVASYEAGSQVPEVLLLFSGGLDTSTMLKWIQDTYQTKVTTLTLDLGQQHDDLEAIKQKALKLGAKEAIVLDVQQEFAEEYLAKGIKANAHYQGDYHLSTPIGRAILAHKAVEMAQKLGISVIAHGCTGKGNDQVRIEGYILAHDESMKIIAPVREWDMSRDEQILYAKENQIQVPADVDFPYSVDDNMWGMTWEGGEIEDPATIPPYQVFLTTYTSPEKAPDSAETIELEFEKGLPVAVNGEQLPLSQLIHKLNQIGGDHGVGITPMVEDRLIGLKNCGVYEQPGGHIIITAHRQLEKYVCTRELNQLKAELDVKWGYLCYGAKWYDPAMAAINAFNDQVNELVTGKVQVKLFKGSATTVAVTSPYGLHYASFNSGEGYQFNVNASPGFIELYTLQMKLANQVTTNSSSNADQKVEVNNV